MGTDLNRRKFLKTGAAVGAGIAMSTATSFAKKNKKGENIFPIVILRYDNMVPFISIEHIV